MTNKFWIALKEKIDKMKLLVKSSSHSNEMIEITDVTHELLKMILEQLENAAERNNQDVITIRNLNKSLDDYKNENLSLKDIIKTINKQSWLKE